MNQKFLILIERIMNNTSVIPLNDGREILSKPSLFINQI